MIDGQDGTDYGKEPSPFLLLSTLEIIRKEREHFKAVIDSLEIFIWVMENTIPRPRISAYHRNHLERVKEHLKRLRAFEATLGGAGRADCAGNSF